MMRLGALDLRKGYGVNVTIFLITVKKHGLTQNRISNMRSIQTLLMVRASFEGNNFRHSTTHITIAQVENNPDIRPYLITRSGCPGIQRYAQTWSGDNNTSWKSLKYNIPMGLGMGLSGFSNTYAFSSSFY